MAAYNELEQSGDLQLYDHAYGPRHFRTDDGPSWITPPRYRKRLRDLVVWGESTIVSGWTGDLTKIDFAKLRYFPELTELQIHGTTDEQQLLDISGVPQLRRLSLFSLGVTDRVVQHFVEMCPDLEEVFLRGEDSRQMTDASLDEICKLSKLRILSIGSNRFTYAGMERLSCLKNLEELYYSASFTDGFDFNYEVEDVAGLGIHLKPKTEYKD